MNQSSNGYFACGGNPFSLSDPLSLTAHKDGGNWGSAEDGDVNSDPMGHRNMLESGGGGIPLVWGGGGDNYYQAFDKEKFKEWLESLPPGTFNGDGSFNFSFHESAADFYYSKRSGGESDVFALGADEPSAWGSISLVSGANLLGIPSELIDIFGSGVGQPTAGGPELLGMPQGNQNGNQTKTKIKTVPITKDNYESAPIKDWNNSYDPCGYGPWGKGFWYRWQKVADPDVIPPQEGV